MRPEILEKFRRLSWRDRALLTEATLWLSLSSAAIALMPFRYVARLAGSPIRPRTRLDLEAEVARVRWAVTVVARRVPFTAVCFQQGLAAHLMLRRRAMPSVLYYGAAQTPGSGLAAHVWVRAGNLDVVGCEEAHKFALLATFPAPPNTAIP